MSSSSSVIRRPRRVARKKGARSNVDTSFNPTSTFPYMNKHLSSDTIFTVQSQVTYSAYQTSSASVPNGAAKKFILNDIQNSGSFTSVFDEYRIRDIEVWLVPRESFSIAAGSNAGLLTSAVDIDDVSAGLISLTDASGAITTPGVCGHYHKWSPRVANSVYSAGAFGAFGAEESPWLDCASPSIEHYGLKSYITVCSQVYIFDLIARYTVDYRRVHA